MDVSVDDILLVILSLWVWLCMVTVSSTNLFITLLLIGLLIVVLVGNDFINPDTKDNLKPMIYFMLFIFFVIVFKKALEVIH